MASGSEKNADDKQTMYAVCPKQGCPHIGEIAAAPSAINSKEKCGDCGDAKENWICLTCYKVYCSRFVNEHMKQHCEKTKHPLTLSFSDLSVWCYTCNDYVHHESFQAAKAAAYKDKFGEVMPEPGKN